MSEGGRETNNLSAPAVGTLHQDNDQQQSQQEDPHHQLPPTPVSNTSLTSLPPLAATSVPVSPGSIPMFTTRRASTTTISAVGGKKETVMKDESHLGTTSPAGSTNTSSVTVPTSPQSPPAGPVPETTKEVLEALWKVALPAAGSSLFMMMPNLVTIAFIGHRLGHGALSELGVSITTFNLFGFSIAIGFICALDTFASQAFGRNPKTPELGILLQRTLCITGILALPVCVLLYFSEPLVAAAFSPTLAHGAHEYLGNSYLFLIGLLINASLMSVINSCRQTQIPLVANISATCCSILLSYYFLDSLATTAYIQAANIFVGNSVMVYYVRSHPELEGIRAATWWPLSAIPVEEVISRDHVRSFMKIGIPSMVAVCSEWWAFEALVVIGAHISDETVGVLNVVFNIFTLFFLTASGLSRGTSIVVGNALGAGKPHVAKTSLWCAIASVMGLNIFTASTIYFMGIRLWVVFTNDEEILKHATNAFCLLLAVCNFFDGIQFVMQGGFRGVGRQNEAASRALCSLWLVGVFMAYVLGLRFNMGVEGIIIGLFLGLLAEIPLFGHCMLKWDWAQLAKEAIEGSTVTDAEKTESDAKETATVVEMQGEKGEKQEEESGLGQFPDVEFSAPEMEETAGGERKEAP